MEGKPFAYHDALASLDPETGRPTYNQDHAPRIDKTTSHCPSLWGGKNDPYQAYNPETGMVYVPAYDNVCNKWSGFAVVAETIRPNPQRLHGWMPGRPFLARRLSLHGSIAPIRKQR